MVSYRIEDRRGRRKALLSDIKGEDYQAAACTPGPTAPNPPQTSYTTARLMRTAACRLPPGSPARITTAKSTPRKLTQWRLSDPRLVRRTALTAKRDHDLPLLFCSIFK